MTKGVGEMPRRKLLFTPPGTRAAASATRWAEAVKVIVMRSSFYIAATGARNRDAFDLVAKLGQAPGDGSGGFGSGLTGRSQRL